MKNYPIIFGFRDLVQGEGYLAGVAVEGRALIHEEEGEYWIEGVHPGGFSAVGHSPAAVLEDFRRSYREILFDIATDASSFEAFEEEVERFYHGHGASERMFREWQAAVEDVRAGRTDADWLGKRSADLPSEIKVERIQEPSTSNNEVEQGTAVAA